MLIRIKRRSDCRESEVTDPELFGERRRFIRRSGHIALLGTLAATGLTPSLPQAASQAGAKLNNLRTTGYGRGEELSSYRDVTRYNNFYEFGTDKEDPAKNARDFEARPWQVSIDGEVDKPGVYDLGDLLRPHTLEERIYRFRCVEAWSMVVPWAGFPLADLIKRFSPTSKAKYVAFTTLHDPLRMPGQRRSVLDWPYQEALRMDEAMHPLTLMTVGLYGEILPNQNGAPLRLIVPWKYGFKSIKSIVRIQFLERPPVTTWAATAPNEYGFYANVNPAVDHPRWSQKKERRLGSFFKIKTRPFNGYGEEVASLYAGMDLRRYF